MRFHSANALDVTGVLDRLVSVECKDEATGTTHRQLRQLVGILDRVAKVNPHQHITGSVGDRSLLKQVIQIYRRDSQAREAFLDYAEECRFIRRKQRIGFFEHSDDDLVTWLHKHIPLEGDPKDFEEADDRLNLVRMAFQSRHEDSFVLLREAYRQVALENAAHGVSEVWFRTSLGDHVDEAMATAMEAAIEGARRAEVEAGEPLRVGFLLGLRKCLLSDSAYQGPSERVDVRSEALVGALRQFRMTTPDIKRMMIGIDSVGIDSGWQPEWQSGARHSAAAAQMHVAIHFGESWTVGALLETLEKLRVLVRHGVIHQLDNANALFAMKDPKSRNQQYADAEWRSIARMQLFILELMAQRGIALGINPSSNDWLTRSLRRREGWRFRELNNPTDQGSASVCDLMVGTGQRPKPLFVVVGNDNSRLYPSRVPGGCLTVSEELANLWDVPGSPGSSVYGKLPTESIGRLIHNGFSLAETASRERRKDPLQLEFNFQPQRIPDNGIPVLSHNGFQPLGGD